MAYNRKNGKKKNKWGQRVDLTNHALVLFAYVARNPDEKQTYRGLAEATGIPFGTLYYLINFDRICPEERVLVESRDPFGYKNMLYAVADAFGYKILLIRKKHNIISVVKDNCIVKSDHNVYYNKYGYNEDYSSVENIYEENV